MKKIAVLQSNYIPWKGYFSLIDAVDEFVILDSVQYTTNDWRNRNLLKTDAGLRWLTIPIRQSGHLGKKISEIKIADQRWNIKHFKTFSHYYARAAYFDAYREWLRALYLDCRLEYLSEINYMFITAICRELGIRTKICRRLENSLDGDKNGRLIGICRQTGATEYISGPSAKTYLDTARFMAAGIRVEWMDYSGYPEYPQLFPPFEHGVSVLDLILNTGEKARQYLTAKTFA